MGPISDFIKHHYRHFNSAALLDAAQGYTLFLGNGGSMLMTLAGAMSTAELGLSLAEMIRRGKGSRHLLHRGQSRGRSVQPCRA